VSIVNDKEGKEKGKRKDGTLESNRTCSGFQSYSNSSGPFELFQLSVLFLFAGERMKGEPQDGVRGVCGEEAIEEREERLSGSCGRGITRASSPGERFSRI
jgi:hypothetical protein